MDPPVSRAGPRRRPVNVGWSCLLTLPRAGLARFPADRPAGRYRAADGDTTPRPHRPPLVGGDPRGAPPSGARPPRRRRSLPRSARRRRQPPRHRPPVRAGPGAARPAHPGGAGPPLRRLQDARASNPDGVRAQLEESLQLLGCDSFDLYQLHAVTDLDELDAARAEAADDPGGQATRGSAGSSASRGTDSTRPRHTATALERYDLDTVMFPVNPRLWADDHYRARRRGAAGRGAPPRRRCHGDQGRRGPALGRPAAHSTTWYEPYTAADELAARDRVRRCRRRGSTPSAPRAT